MVVSKMLVPQVERLMPTGFPSDAVVLFDAATRGTTDGIKLALNVGVCSCLYGIGLSAQWMVGGGWRMEWLEQLGGERHGWSI